MKTISAILFAAILALVLCSCQKGERVQAVDKPLAIPTYKIGPPANYPYWKREVYPYTMQMDITDSLGTKTYNAVVLENEYVKILVLPDIGGRLHYAIDKTNGYTYLYNQKTIKPAKVGLTGAWISGGIEYNFPVGHRASGFRPVDYTVERNSDGSVIVWTGEYERLKGMRWSVGHTLRPGSNVLETKVRLYNSTPYVHAFQWWATAAVHITPEYQAVYPMDIWTGHGKTEFGRFPIYEGKDISFWKNTVDPNSYFAWDCPKDFFGGYSHDLNAGTVVYGDHHVVPGKKLWTWGTGGVGQMWCKILTDSGGHYFEPQAGGYSDNQPDQHWIKPGETKVFSHYWYPVRELGAYMEANLEGACNLEEKGNGVFIGVNTTRERSNLQVTLAQGGKILLQKTVSISPARPFTETVAKPEGFVLTECKLTVTDGKKELLAYQPEKTAERPIPQAVYHGEAVAQKVTTLDSLYEIGAYHNRFDEVGEALEFFNEALRRDPLDTRCNLEKAIILLKRGLADSALPLLKIAQARDPENGATHYYLGLAELQKQDTVNAYEHISRSAYDREWMAPAYYLLAQLDAKKGDLAKALAKIEASLDQDRQNSQAWALKTAILRLNGKKTKAAETAGQALKLDPLNFWLAHEAALLVVRGPEEGKLLRNDPYNHISLAQEYANIGQEKEALRILDACTNQQAPYYPMVQYFRGYYLTRQGDTAGAKAALAAAGQTHSPTCWPARLEDAEVLREALTANPQDASALNYLALLLYAKKQPAAAQALWEKSAAIRPNGDVYRNLGWTLWRDQKQLEKGREYLAKAVEMTKEPQYLYELAQVTAKIVKDPVKVHAFLDGYPDLIDKHDDLLGIYCGCLILEGKYAPALDRIMKHQFHSWEGGDMPHAYYKAALNGLAQECMRNNDPPQALAWLDSALQWPYSLQVSYFGERYEEREHYMKAQVYKKLNQPENAKKELELAAKVSHPPYLPILSPMYTGLALRELGREAEARQQWQKMVDQIDLRAKRNGGMLQPRFRFILSEVYKCLGNPAKSNENLKQALDEEMLAPLRAGSLSYSHD